jgi:hypothetical protein
MCIKTLYSLTCTRCRSQFCEPRTGSWTFESEKEVVEVAKNQGWLIGEIVPNGSKWDFCPRCKSTEEQRL